MLARQNIDTALSLLNAFSVWHTEYPVFPDELQKLKLKIKCLKICLKTITCVRTCFFPQSFVTFILNASLFPFHQSESSLSSLSPLLPPRMVFFCTFIRWPPLGPVPGKVIRSPLYSMTSARAILHSITSVENSSLLPKSVKPTTQSFVLPSFTKHKVGRTRILSLSVN